MNMEQFTQKSRQALADAQQLAAREHHQEMGGKHLLMALLDQEEGLARRLLEQAGVNTASFQQQLEQLLGKIPAVYGYEGAVVMSSSLARVLTAAGREAAQLKDEGMNPLLFP